MYQVDQLFKVGFYSGTQPITSRQEKKLTALLLREIKIAAQLLLGIIPYKIP